MKMKQLVSLAALLAMAGAASAQGGPPGSVPVPPIPTPPVVAPPVVAPPVITPPVIAPPVITPPVATPVALPAVGGPPVSTPAVGGPPVITPRANQGETASAFGRSVAAVAQETGDGLAVSEIASRGNAAAPETAEVGEE